MTDESLMSAYQKGSEEAFLRLFEKYSPMVYGFAAKRLRESEANTFFLSTWRRLHTEKENYQGQEFLPWFYSQFAPSLTEKVKALGRISERPESPNEPVDFESFLKSSESPPEELSLLVKKDILLSFRKKQIYFRFVLFFLVGALAPLSFGMKSYQMLLCALGGWVAVFIGLKWEEIRWVFRRIR